MPEARVKSRSPSRRTLLKRLDEFEAIVRAHEMRGSQPPLGVEEIEEAYNNKRREFENIILSLLNIAES